MKPKFKKYDGAGYCVDTPHPASLERAETRGDIDPVTDRKICGDA